MGPASHEAIRRGQIEYNYDVPFVVAEVNADVVRWKEDEKALDGFRKLSANKSQYDIFEYINCTVVFSGS